jgi:hypothetical protein
MTRRWRRWRGLRSVGAGPATRRMARGRAAPWPGGFGTAWDLACSTGAGPARAKTLGTRSAMRPVAEGGGPLSDERLNGSVGTPLGAAGGRRAGGLGPVERHGVLDAWRGRISAGRRWRGWRQGGWHGAERHRGRGVWDLACRTGAGPATVKTLGTHSAMRPTTEGGGPLGDEQLNGDRRDATWGRQAAEGRAG